MKTLLAEEDAGLLHMPGILNSSTACSIINMTTTWRSSAGNVVNAKPALVHVNQEKSA